MKNALFAVYRRILPSLLLSQLQRELSGYGIVLDLGCGRASRLTGVRIKRSVGVDAFEPYLRENRKRDSTNDYVLADITTFAAKAKSFDAVVALEVVEHLEKADAIHLIEDMERWARRKVIILTPNGFVHQQEYDANPYQVHRSRWEMKEFAQLGFEVRGMGGPSRFRDSDGHICCKPALLWSLISDLQEWIQLDETARSFQLFCVKRFGP